MSFVQKILGWPCHGDPRFTCSDVEHAIQNVVDERNYIVRFELRAAEQFRAAEVRELERLEAKYRGRDQVDAEPVPAVSEYPGTEDATPSRPENQAQMSLS